MVHFAREVNNQLGKPVYILGVLVQRDNKLSENVQFVLRGEIQVPQESHIVDGG